MDNYDKTNKHSLSLDGQKWRSYVSDADYAYLVNSMAQIRSYQHPTPSFKLYGRTDVSLVTDFLDDIAEDHTIPSWMLAYEKSRVSKFGPQGGHVSWDEARELFDLYYSNPKAVDSSKDVFQRAISKLIKLYRGLHCRKLAFTDTLKYLKDNDKIGDKAAGWPLFSLKKTDGRAQENAIWLARTGKYIDGVGYISERFQKQKARIFMPMPFSSMVAQAQWYVDFLRRIQESLRQAKYKSPYVFWADKIGFAPCFNEIFSGAMGNSIIDHDDCLVYVQRDFTKMDTTTGSSQYSTMFIPVMAAAHHCSVDNESLIKAMLFTTECPLISPGQRGIEIHTGTHGTASGAEVTNGGETVCNHTYDLIGHELLSSMANEHGITFWRVISVGNGDDGAAVYRIKRKDLDIFKQLLERAYSEAASICKFDINFSKWHISTEYGLYCQNMFWFDDNNFCNFCYPAALILNSIINPEHQYTAAKWDKDYRDLDICSKLDNGANLPYFHRLVDYVAKGMKYPLLGSSELETSRILSKYEQWRSLQSSGEMYNRMDWNITNSPTVKYILSKRS